jgi:hypothetical protein
MVTLPPEFVATKFPGYFWNYSTMKLYSLKVSGELTPLKHIKPNYFNNWSCGGYKVSVKGNYKVLFDDYLHNIKPSDTQIAIWRKNDG